jgi:EpsI family protein
MDRWPESSIFREYAAMIATFRPPLLCFLMLAGAASAAILKPTVLLAEQVQSIDLEKMVPKRFDDWKMVSSGEGQIVDPGQRELMNAIYTQTLTRTYANSEGYLVMLSIAYGKNQRDALQVHKPEICYPAQGFSLVSKESGELSRNEPIPVTRMQTTLGSRQEPVTYWTMIGDQPYAGNLQKKMIETRYGLAGTIPDGMLVRVSSIDMKTEAAHKAQADFSLALIDSLPADVRSRFSGQSRSKQ